MIFLITFMKVYSQVNWINQFTSPQGDALYQGTCNNGFIQSPIDVNNQNSYYNFSVGIVYENYSSILTGLTKSDKYINLNSTAGLNLGNILFERYGYLSMYNLTDVRIKVPSEHSINGVKGAMEIQLIHKKNIGQYFTQNQNVPLPDANTYLGISLVYTTSNSNYTDNGFAKDLINAYNLGVKNINLHSYQITFGRKFYLYEGSETNYPCDENFNWVVFADMINIDTTSLSVVTNQYNQSFVGGSNVKSLGSLGARPIYRNFKLGSNDNKVFVYPINSSTVTKVNSVFLFVIVLIFLWL